MNMHQTEEKIVNKLLEDCFKLEGVLVCVNDGEETHRCPDAKTAFDHIDGVEESVIEIRTLDYFKCKCWILLVRGNGHDIISDYLDNEFTRELVKNASELAGQLQDVD